MNLIEQLLTSALAESERNLCILRIEKDVDMSLARDLFDFLRGRDLSAATVLSTLCYYNASLLALAHPDEKSACSIIQEYSDYMHQALHAVYKKRRDERLSDVENNT